MQNLSRMGVFAVVARELSLSKAADKLGFTKSAVSRQVSTLEEALGVKLLYRGTRRSRLTDEGQMLYPYCEEILQRYNTITELAEQLKATPSGKLTLEMPETIATHIVLPHIQSFQQQYPLINLDLRLRQATFQDITDELDVCILSGQLPESSIVCRRIADQKLKLYASRDYIKAFGQPKTPQDLAAHRCIVIEDVAWPDTHHWTFKHRNEMLGTYIKATSTVNNIVAAKNMVLNGMGISIFQEFAARQEEQSGELVPLLSNYKIESIPVYVLYPDRKQLSPKIRAMVDFIVECFEREAI